MLITILLFLILLAIAPDLVIGLFMLAFWLGVVALIGGLLFFGAVLVFA